MVKLVQALAVAKSRQDVPAALKLMHPRMLLVNPAFGTAAQGLAENEKALTRFFRAFPTITWIWRPCRRRGEPGLLGDRTDDLDRRPIRGGTERKTCRAAGPHQVHLRGRPDRKRTVFFDLSELCAQSGVSTDAVRRKLFGDV